MTSKDIVIKQHDDGTFYARPYLGTNAVTGKPIRPYKRFPEAVDEGEALEMAREWLAGLSGAAGMRTTMRLAEVLDRYITANEAQWADNTAKAYRNCLHWIEPVLGDVDVDEVKPHLVEAAYNVLLLRGGANGKALSSSSVRQVHGFLCGAFKWIVKSEVSPFNPMASVAKPRLERGEAQAFCEADFAALQRALAGAMADGSTARANVARRTCAMAAYLSLVTGERCGEVCANTVADAQLGRRLMHVAATVVEPRGKGPRRQARTKGGRSRNVSLGDAACEAIREHLGWQRAFLPDEAAADRERAICCGPSGELLRPSAVSKGFRALRDELKLPAGTSFHTLRHTHATMLIVGGADMRTVQERLGHANVSTTLSLYAHVVEGRDRAAADAFEAVSARIEKGA